MSLNRFVLEDYKNGFVGKKLVENWEYWNEIGCKNIMKITKKRWNDEGDDTNVEENVEENVKLKFKHTQ